MPYSASAGLTIALASASTTTYQLTDHNRQPIKLDYEIIEKASRMADGTLRRYVVARKKKFSTSWQMIPSGTGLPSNSSTFKNQNLTHTVDGYKGGAWMKDFYENNLFVPMILTITHSRDTASANAASAFYPSPSNTNAEKINCIISSFSYEVVKRYSVTDFVNVSIEFTEI
jgi:hypothetical protein